MAALGKSARNSGAVHLQWDGAQLGQVTKLTWGQDKGWRGGVRLSAALTGTPKNLTVDTEASIEDFRRYDIAGDQGIATGGAMQRPLQFFGSCSLRGWPAAPRSATVESRSTAALPSCSAVRGYDLTMLAQNLPVQPLVEFARRVKKNVPADMIAAGKLDAKVTLRREPAATGSGPVWQGGGAGDWL